MTPKFIYFESYGCTANQNNTEIMKNLVRQAGLDITNKAKIADIIVINTCSVKSPTENKIKRKIQDLRKEFSKKPIILSSCMVDIYGSELTEKNTNIYLLSTHHIKEIAKLIKLISENKLDEKNQKKFLTKEHEVKLGNKIKENKIIGISQIAEGCVGRCSFCQTCIAKGAIFSYPEKKIIENIKKDLKQESKEIHITSQDNAAYGLDSKKYLLPELLAKILKLKGKFKIRLGMMNPDNVLPILDKLIEIYKDKKMFKFIHIPIQSGSNKILKDMNRKYKIKDFSKILIKLRKQIPDITLSTDIIVGYPTETKKDFQQTLDIIKQIEPDALNISKFWPRKKTPSAKLRQLSPAIIKSRAAKLVELHRKIAKQKNQFLVGKTIKIIVDKKLSPNLYQGRDKNYKIIIINLDKNLLGKYIKVKIKKAFTYHLLGEII